jgi:peroxiredoxin
MTTVDALLLAGRLLLAAVFILAGVTKLRDRAGTRQALAGFGVPGRAVAPAAIALPLLELAIASALLPVGIARYGAVFALALLLVFIAAMADSLRHGRRPECHCFGQIAAAPIGWRALARNGALVALTAVVTVAGWNDPGPSIVAWLAPLTAFQRAVMLGGAIVIAFLGVQNGFLIALVRQNQRLLRHLMATPPMMEASAAAPHAAFAGLPVGSTAPSFALATLDGETVTLNVLRARGRPVLLLFSDPACGACNALLPEIGRWQQETEQHLTLALISRDSVEANRAKSSEHGIARVLLQQDREVAQAYGVPATPSAVLIRPDGMIGSPLAQGADAIRALVTAAIGLPVGQDVTAIGVQPDSALVVPRDALPVRDACVRDALMEDGTIVLYNDCQARTLTLNPTAALIWECCDGEHDVMAIVAEVREIFPEAPDTERDVLALLNALTQAGMVSCAAI